MSTWSPARTWAPAQLQKAPALGAMHLGRCESLLVMSHSLGCQNTWKCIHIASGGEGPTPGRVETARVGVLPFHYGRLLPELIIPFKAGSIQLLKPNL